MSNNKFYIPINGATMGPSLSPILCNIFFSHHRENWLDKCPIEFKPRFYRGYTDDIFCTFWITPESANSANCKYMSSKHQNINFTVEHENINSFQFLNVEICCENNTFVTSAYRKATFSGVFNSFKRGGFVHILLHFIGASAYVVFSRHFIWKSMIWRLSSGKTFILHISLICVLNHFLIIFIHYSSFSECT